LPPPTRRSRARRDLHDDAVDAAVGRALDVIDDAARERVDLRREPAARDLAYGGFVGRRDGRQTGLDPLHARLGEFLGDPDLVVLREDDAGLLLAVAEGHVVHLH